MALQPGKGKVDGKHYLPSTPETVQWGHLPTADTRPVLTVDSGVTVTIDSVSHEGILTDEGRDPTEFFGRFGVPPAEVLADAVSIAASGTHHQFGIDGPHVVTGPVHVRDALPGDVLRVEVVSLHPRARYGIVANRHGSGLLAGEFPEGEPPDADADARHWEGFRTATTFFEVERRRGRLLGSMAGTDGRKVRFPLTPFMGIMAVATGGPGPLRSDTAGSYGGNLRCRDLGVGARLFLPVQVDGALFSAGDPNYAQGEGAVGRTALAAPLRATFRLTVLRAAAARAVLGAIAEPFAETDTHWIVFGIDADLVEAYRNATRSAVTFLASRLGLARADALAYLSSAADFSVGGVVDDVRTVHCMIRRADFGEPAAPKARLPRPGFSRSSAPAQSGAAAQSASAQSEGDPASDPAVPSPTLPTPSSAPPNRS